MSQENELIIEVITAVVDTKELTLYLKDGSTKTIPQGDPRVKRIVEEITPILMANEVAKVNLDYDKTTEFAKFEEKTNGVVKFFRVAKQKLQSFLNRTEALFVGEHVDPQVIGRTDNEPEEESNSPDEDTTVSKEEAIERVASALAGAVPVKELTPTERMQKATDDILKHAVPVTDHHFADHQVGDNQDKHALVAVVADKVIPNVQHLHSQIKHVNDGGDSEGLVNLMKRVSQVKRGHSVDDLMKFLKKGDLPIAKDGSIIIYKRLNQSDSKVGDYVDCHSGRVTQRVGDIVCMAEKMVDHNRRVDCSNGLHVARRQYLGSFNGNKMILAKVNPEDVIAVPEYDANKMRVCAYHILFEIPEKDAAKLNSNRPIEKTDQAAILLARALAGDYPPARRRVEITEGKGGGLKITDLSEKVDHKHQNLEPVAALEDKSIIDPAMTSGPKVNPADVIPVEKTVSKPETRTEQVQRLFKAVVTGSTATERLEAAKELTALRKGWKKSWDAIEINADGVKKIERALATDPTVAKVAPVSKKKVIVKGKLVEKQAPSKISAVPPAVSGGAQKLKKAVKPVTAPTPAPVAAKPPVRKPEPGDSPRVFIAYLMEDAMAGDVAAAQEIVSTKKGAKKSWDKLGVTAVQVHKLESLTKK